MTYHIGISGPRGPVCVPHFTCDGDGCKTTRNVLGPRSMGAPNWFLAGKAPPGWRSVPSTPHSDIPTERMHYCPRCKGAIGGDDA